MAKPGDENKLPKVNNGAGRYKHFSRILAVVNQTVSQATDSAV
jgi:hypothetical protein